MGAREGIFVLKYVSGEVLKITIVPLIRGLACCWGLQFEAARSVF